MKKFAQANTVVMGCSADSIALQAKFKEKHKLNFILLSDPGFKCIEAYGARRMKRFLGRSFLGIVRSTFWIGTDGKIKKAWDSVSVKGHAMDVLKTITAEKAA